MHSIILIAALNFIGAFEYMSNDPIMLLPYEYAVQDYRQNRIVINPSLIPFTNGVNASFSCGKPYMGSDISGETGQIQYSNRGFGTSIYWNKFGTDFHMENTFSLSAGYSPIDLISLGLTGNIYDLRITDNSFHHNRQITDYDLAMSSKPFDFMTFSLIINNIKSEDSQDTIVSQSKCAGIQIEPNDNLSLSWNINTSSVGNINTFIANASPMKNIILRAAYSRETYTLAASISVLIKNLSINYGLRQHEYLGYSHFLGITLSGETFSQIGQKRIIKSIREEKININRASISTLIERCSIPELLAKRIIKYRKKFGPISTEALYRIGFNKSKIDELEAHIYGLEDDSLRFKKSKKNKFRKFSKKSWMGKKKNRIKIIFKKLIRMNVRASKALRYSEIYVWNRKNLLHILAKDTELPKDEKKAILSICE